MSAGASAASPVKLMSYNVRNGIGIDGTKSVDRIARVIKAQSPEIVAVQELDSVTGRSGGRYVLGELAAASGMKATYAPAIDYDGGKYGIGILSKEQPLRVSRHSLPGREEARALVVVELPDYIFACTHLSLTREDRLASVAIIRKMAAEAGKPFFIAGDFNAHPDSEVIADFKKDFTILTDTTLRTFPADKPVETLDYIMMYNPGNAKVQTAGVAVVDEPAASDHRPVTVSVTLPKSK